MLYNVQYAILEVQAMELLDTLEKDLGSKWYTFRVELRDIIEANKSKGVNRTLKQQTFARIVSDQITAEINDLVGEVA